MVVVPDDVEDAALAEFWEAKDLYDAGDQEGALRRYETLVATYGPDAESTALRELLAGALVNVGQAAEMAKDEARARAAYGALVRRFDPSESDYIAECVAIARDRYQRRTMPRPWDQTRW